MYGSTSANKSALLTKEFLRSKNKNKKRRDVVTHVAPIKFCIPCILDCQGIESSVGGTDEGVLSAVWKTGSEDGDEV